jgi:excisionase family DNA binding protein
MSESRRTLSPRSVFLDEAAARLGVSRRTVYYRIREGKLKTIRTLCGSQRVLVDSIDAFLRERTNAQAARRCMSQTEALPLQIETLS